jgi:hypothetical protein
MKKILFIWIFALAALAAGAQNPPTSLSERLGELEKELDKAKEDVEKAAAEMAACNKLPADQITSITNRIKQIKEEMDKVDNEKAKREKEIQKRIKQIKRQQAKLKKEAARATGFKNTKELNKALKRLQEEEKNAADTPPAALGGLQENMEKERSEEFKKIATEGAKKTDARTKEGKSLDDLLSDYDAGLTQMENLEKQYERESNEQKKRELEKEMQTTADNIAKTEDDIKTLGNAAGMQTELSNIRILDFILYLYHSGYFTLHQEEQQLEKELKNLKEANNKLHHKLTSVTRAGNTLTGMHQQKMKDKDVKDHKKKIDGYLRDYNKPKPPATPPIGPDGIGFVIVGPTLTWPNMEENNEYIEWINEQFEGNINTTTTVVGGSVAIAFRLADFLSVGPAYEYQRARSSGEITYTDLVLKHENQYTFHSGLLMTYWTIPHLDNRFQPMLQAGLGATWGDFLEKEEAFELSGKGETMTFSTGLSAQYFITDQIGLSAGACYQWRHINEFLDENEVPVQYVGSFRQKNIDANMNGMNVLIGLVFRF